MTDDAIKEYFTDQENIEDKVKLFRHLMSLIKTKNIMYNILADYILLLAPETKEAWLEVGKDDGN